MGQGLNVPNEAIPVWLVQIPAWPVMPVSDPAATTKLPIGGLLKRKHVSSMLQAE